MTTNEPKLEGADTSWISALIIVVVGTIIWAGLLITDFHPLRFRIIREEGKLAMATTTPLPSPTVEPSPTPEPTATPEDLAPFSDDEAHRQYRSTFMAAYERLAARVGALELLNQQFTFGNGGTDDWYSSLATTCLDVDALAGEWMFVWPPGPYNASNPLTDAHSRLLQAEMGAMVACRYLTWYMAPDHANDWTWEYPDDNRAVAVDTTIGIVRDNLEYSMSGYTLDLYGNREVDRRSGTGN